MLSDSSLLKRLSDELPCEGGSEELRMTRPEGLVETWGEVDSSVAKGDWESSPKS